MRHAITLEGRMDGVPHDETGRAVWNSSLRQPQRGHPVACNGRHKSSG